MTTQRRDLGTTGEERAARWYEENGYEVLARNWRNRVGELDLVLCRGRTIVFCEVKTRSSSAFGTPAEAVTRTKRERIRHLASLWLMDSPLRAREIRFDVAEVTRSSVEVIEGAF